MKKDVKDFINGKVTYDNMGQYLWINTPNGCQMLGELRGWGAIQNLKDFKKGGSIDTDEAGKYQDKIGEWIAEAINEKREREQSENKK